MKKDTRTEAVIDDRWLVVPTTGGGSDTDPIRPKYAERVAYHASTPVEVRPGQRMYVGRFFATPADMAALMDESDVFALADGDVSADEIARWLNDASATDGDDRHLSEWADLFDAPDTIERVDENENED